jgi:hypothetical protein
MWCVIEGIKMICEECGKKLSVFKGYRHPTMGRKHSLCSPCFDQVSESVAKWKEFVLSYSFHMNPNESSSSINFEKIKLPFLKKWNRIETVWLKKESM